MKGKRTKSAPKRRRPKIKKEDRISLLPDCLLVDIISRLDSTEEAIRTGTLSKRWQHLWLQLPNLIFKHDVDDDDDRIIEFYSSLENILNQYAQMQSNINKFQLHASYTYEANIVANIENCIRYAIDLNVREFDIDIWDTGFVLPEFFFGSSSFIHLNLCRCFFRRCNDVICWKNLRSLSVAFCNLHEDLIQNILSGSPLLETLELEDCFGFERLDITNKSVKNLVISGELDDEDEENPIKINAPYILSLTIEDHVLLVKLLLVNVSSVIQAELDYSIKRYFEPEERHKDQEKNEELLKGFILSLSHAKELKIGKFCSKVLARLKAKGFICPPNLKILEEIDSN